MLRATKNLSVNGLAVALGSATLSQTTVGILAWGGDFLTASYVTLPGNRPKDYTNVFYLWEGTEIPWGIPPDARKAVGSNATSGDVTFGDIIISQTSYVIGYAPGPDPTYCCASIVLDAGGLVSAPRSISIGVASIGTTSVTIRYEVLPGYRPLNYGNWMGIWEGEVSPYNAGKPLGKKPLKDVTSGTITIDDVPIKINTMYTVVYFMHDIEKEQNNTTAAAILRFQSTPQASPATKAVLAVHRPL